MAKSEREEPYTTGEFFELIVNQFLKEEGDNASIIESVSPERWNLKHIRESCFDVVFKLEPGTSEGLYLSFYALGDIGALHESCGRYPLGSIKCLETSKEAYLEMSRIGASIMYAANTYKFQHACEFEWKGYKVIAFADGYDERGIPLFTASELNKAMATVDDWLENTKITATRVEIIDLSTRQIAYRKEVKAS